MTSALVVQFGQLSYYQPGAGHVVSSYYTHRWWENAKKQKTKQNIYLNCEERCNSSWETNEKIKFGLERDSNPWPLRYRKTGISLLQSPTKVLARLPTFAASVWETYQFTPSPRFNVVYRDEFVIARFQHCLGEGGGKGVLCSSDVITDCFQNTLVNEFSCYLIQACQGLLSWIVVEFVAKVKQPL